MLKARDIGRATDKLVLLILIGGICATVLAVAGALAGGYFIISVGSAAAVVSKAAFIGDFNTVTVASIHISGLAGGLTGGILTTIYHNEINGTHAATEANLKAYALAAVVGATTGAIFASMDEIIGDRFWIAIIDVALGAISGTAGGFSTLFIKVPAFMTRVADYSKSALLAHASVGGIVTTVTAVVIGEFVGGYFTSSMIFVGLIAIAYSIVSMATGVFL